MNYDDTMQIIFIFTEVPNLNQCIEESNLANNYSNNERKESFSIDKKVVKIYNYTLSIENKHLSETQYHDKI